MSKQTLIQKIILQIQILRIQIQILIYKKKLTVPNENDPTKIILHHSAGDWSFHEINQAHKNRWGFRSSLGYFIGYTYFIDKDGTVHQGRSDIEEGAHTRGFNRGTIGICLQGNFELENPSDRQLEVLEWLMERKFEQYNMDRGNVWLHRKFANTLCPGKNFIKALRDKGLFSN